MKLKELLADIEVLKTNADMELEITEIAYDSRKVQPGGMFVAVTGFATDGNRFIPMALEKGAAVIVTAKEPETDFPYVLVASDRLALAYLGRNFYGNPASCRI
jgi:UDP-N-acetylmuramoyl-L-alanyl-D-glutamate--2,6-diaminopimelate ligase